MTEVQTCALPIFKEVAIGFITQFTTSRILKKKKYFHTKKNQQKKEIGKEFKYIKQFHPKKKLYILLN